ncbi:MAG TPA: chromosome segregation protein SMC [Holophagaceae bacterium]|nr:chromosome segregation protein SMC [Holophagaceae bacterium]
MRLISLELNGFKSFADPQILRFPQGMTAVVGPNGCGKSNISDSLAWVLGEQRASMLRGSEMADVIFAGTSTRKPMGLAEVKLTLEMPDPALPGAFKEMVIQRRLYRSEGSEYRINGRESRLKDVQDMLLDTGMGTRAYSFIQQGQIDLILSTKPKDRRSLIEEAAGITRYKLRRQEAERRLDETKANLQRLEDILFELNKQMDSLKRQAAKARRAAELDNQIKATQRILLAGKATELENAKQRILDGLDALERRVAELTAQAAEKATEVEQLRLEAGELESAQMRRSRSIEGLAQRLEMNQQGRLFEAEKKDEAVSNRERLQGRLDELTGRLTESGAGMEALEDQSRQAGNALEAREALLAEADEALALSQGSLRHAEGELRNLKQKRAEAEAASVQRRRQKEGILNQIAQIEGRLDALNHDEAVRAPRLESLQSEVGTLDRQAEGALELLEQAEEAARVQRATAERLEVSQREGATALHKAEADLEAAERSLRHLSDLLNQGSTDLELRKGVAWFQERYGKAQTIADLLKVDESVRPDVERILGSWLQTAAATEEGLRSSKEAPGHLLLAPDTDSHAPSAPFGTVPLRNHLRWSGASAPLRALLDRAFQCKDDDFASLAKKHPEFALVSPAFLKLPFGPVQVGISAPSASPLKLRAEFEAAKAQREELLTRLEELESSVKKGVTEAQEARERSREIDEDLRSARLKAESLRAQKAHAQIQLDEIRQAQERADQQWEQFEAEIERLRVLLRELDAVPEEHTDEALLEAITQAEGAVHAAQAALEERREAKFEAARVRDSAWAERDGLIRQLQLFQRSRFDLEAEVQRVEMERAELLERVQGCDRKLEELESEAQTFLDERARLHAALQEHQPRLEELQDRLRVEERAGRELQGALENARTQHQEVLLHGAQVQGSMEAMAKEVELALGLEVPAFLASITDEEREAWGEGEIVHQTRLNELQGKRLDLGGVNPLAIQELQEAEERLSFMNIQRDDVLAAIKNLETTISEINQTSEERFREAFDYVNAKFGEVFREVFGGGTAHLSLQDPKDILECGIEITAQPPGKSAKALTLLSGGEKALTAISLLFAIFHFKPSPFCVLDEVDAPLDEANVARFAGMVQKMKTETQFIVITHQKPTMVASDTLYGVTQEEPGVSKLVSVQLKEAEQLV